MSPSLLFAEGLIAIQSPFAAKLTMDRFEENARQHGLNIFARIDHAAGAARVGKILRPTELLIFGNPQGGTPLMECAQTIGIDLPLKALVWQDAEALVWLGYNDPAFIAQRHHVANAAAMTAALTTLLSELAAESVAR